MGDSVIDIIGSVTQAWPLWKITLFFLICGLVFGTLEYFFPARTDQTYKRESVKVDLIYWLFTPIGVKIFTSLCLAVVAGLIFLVLGRPFDENLLKGFGPVSRQPEWLQLIEVLIITDFVGYWSHRWFHMTRMWKFHAVHHSPKRLDWLSGYRMHPMNDALSRVFQSIPLLALGFSPMILEPYIIIIVVYVVFLHSNIRWTFGPFKYVLAGPTFHRWHHSSEPEALDMNYSVIFPIWDILFGTWYYPDRQPSRYGVKDDSVPERFLGQLIHPFIWSPPIEGANPTTPPVTETASIPQSETAGS
jgi:sterol desaturase/sphingolipid hydroxylase (fatty acid hydroxylase superfamily)